MSGRIIISRREFLLLAGGTIGTAMLPCRVAAASDRRQSGIQFMESTCEKEGEGMPKRILIAYASRCGSTGEVAEAMGNTLCDTGVSTDVRLVENVHDLSSYQGVILGSAIRAGKWLPEAVDFVKKHQDTLSRMPVAFFVVCMAMKDDTPENRRKTAAYLDPLYEQVPGVQPKATGLFAGATDFQKLSFMQRSILKAKGIPEGDFRDWEGIRAWAGNVRSGMLS